ncbi:MAG: hypothetical protein IH948_01540 [Bacteroidetes bacterium]|nr:hypothetical protein [Bacteroidota bacterium]
MLGRVFLYSKYAACVLKLSRLGSGGLVSDGSAQAIPFADVADSATLAPRSRWSRQLRAKVGSGFRRGTGVKQRWDRSPSTETMLGVTAPVRR